MTNKTEARTPEEQAIWLQVYCAALTGLHARGWPMSCVLEEAAREASKALDLFEDMKPPM